MNKIIYTIFIGWVLTTTALATPIYQVGSEAKFGYTYGQNGMGWPSVMNEPLANNNRGGFYLSWLKASGSVAFDSNFSATVAGNVPGGWIMDAYVTMKWKGYMVNAGLFRGAGLKSGSGIRDFDNLTIERPFYSRSWSGAKRLHYFRDYGIQFEKKSLGDKLCARLFLHNANGQNVTNNIPSNFGKSQSQATGLDFSLDFAISERVSTGGHVGMLAHKEWLEYFGRSNAWKVGNWFKENAVVDYSWYHQYKFAGFHTFNEAMLLFNRPVQKSNYHSWGFSSLFAKDYLAKYTSYIRYEYYDHTDGLESDDEQHFITLGTSLRPNPEYDLKLSLEYNLIREESFEESLHNDVLFFELELAI